MFNKKQSSPRARAARTSRSAGVEALEPRRLLAVDPIIGLTTRTYDSSPQGFTALGGHVLFAASGDYGTELYTTDGTAQGTRMVSDIMPGPTSSSPANFLVIGDLAFFTARTNATGRELYCTDGTSAGTRLVADLAAGTASSTITAMTPFDGRLYFGAGSNMWRTDGTTAGTTNVWPSGRNDPVTVGYGSLAVFGDELFFVGSDEVYGRELRAMDAEGNVRLVADVSPGSSSSNPARLMAAGDRLFFNANGGSGAELFATDGTTVGTGQVADVNPGTASSNPAMLGAFGDRVFFTATTAGSWPGTTQLFISDGTPGGTTALSAPMFTQIGLALGSYTVFAGGLAFAASDEAGGAEPWTSDGTPDGTHPAADLNPGPAGSYPTAFGTVDGQVYFRASTPAGSNWWVTDGTTAGTQRFGHDYSPGGPAVLSGSRISAYSFPVTGLEPVAVDPATHEVRPLGDVNTIPVQVTADQFTRAGQYVYFRANGLLWRTDGTSVGTLCLNVAFSFGKPAADGRFFFVNTSQLFVTDGTLAGTQQIGNFPSVVSDLAVVGDKVVAVMTVAGGNVHMYAAPQVPSTDAPTLLTNFGNQINHVKLTKEANGRVFFSVKSFEYPSIGYTDGTPAGTIRSRPPNTQYGGTISFVGVTSTAAYFLMGDGISSVPGLYHVDSVTGVTSAATYLDGGMYGGGYIFNDQLIVMAGGGLYRSVGSTMERYADIPKPTAPYDFAPTRGAATADFLYFIAGDDASSGSTLWRTDGTTASMVSPILQASGAHVPFTGFSSPQRLVATSEIVYFNAAGELYVSDGTAAGTHIEPGGSGTMYAEQFSVTRAALDDAVMTYAIGGNYPLVRIAPDVMGSIAGRVFIDDDGDGQLDAGEAVRRGRRVYIDLDQDDQLDPGEPRQLADAAGQYRFGALPPGTYAVRPELEVGEWLTTDAGVVVLSTGQTATRDLSIGYEDTVPPQVTGVFVRGSAWSSAFSNFLQSSGQGDSAFGYRLDASNHADELPWTNLNRISIRFSEDVNVSADDLNVYGIRTGTYPLAATNGFTYHPVTFTATWTLAASIAADKLLLDLDAGGVTDTNSNALDGEWTNPATGGAGGADSFPSGDGIGGGDFLFRLNVLPGDVNRSGGSILGSDVTLTRNAQNSTPGAPNSLYTIFKDVNGSGSILGSDVTLVRNRQGSTLPAVEPAPPAPAAAAEKTSVTDARKAPINRSSLFATGPNVRSAMRLFAARFDLLGDTLEEPLVV